MERRMTRISYGAALALVASLTVSFGGYARADTGASDMDIRLLCHEQAHRGWPCDEQYSLMVGDTPYRVSLADRGGRYSS
jgi:hypothetical protein